MSPAGARDWYQAPVPWRRRVTARPGRAAAAAAVVVIAAAVAIGSVIEPGPAPHAVTIPSATPSSPARPAHAQATMVDVRLGALIGQPVAAAAQRLRQQGLSVRIRWRHSGEQPPGTVLSVRPAGPRPVGSTVTLTAVLKRAGDAGDGQGGHGQDGNGKGGHKHHPGAGPVVG